MKKFITAILIVTTLFTTSCSKDDGSAPITIESTLTTSKQAYQDAKDGDWIIITKSEYDALAKKLNDVSKIATKDENYLTDDSKISAGGSGFTIANDNGVTIPKNSYVFAFRFFSKTDNHTGVKVKISETDVKNGYSNLGKPLPSVNKGDNFFIIKNNNTKISKTGYLALYFSRNVSYDSSSRGNTKHAENRGDVNNISNYYDGNSSVYFMYQGLSTTEKQW